MLRYRLILGFLFGAILLALFYFDCVVSRGWPQNAAALPPGTLVMLLIVVAIPPAIVEMQRLLDAQNVHISMRISVFSALLCALWPWLEQVADTIAENPQGSTSLTARVVIWCHTVKPQYLVPTVLVVSLVGALIMHSRHQMVKGALASAGGTLLAVVYLGVLPGFYLPICLTHSAGMIVSILLIVKFADIGAYTFGRLFGRHKLIAWLSPGKTVEGFAGGLIVAALTGALLTLCSPNYPFWEGIVAGVLLGAVGQCGDLLESMLKRDAGVKDSGHVPGFGGLLDMLDSPLLAGPVAYWMLKLVHKS